MIQKYLRELRPLDLTVYNGHEEPSVLNLKHKSRYIQLQMKMNHIINNKSRNSQH